MDHDEFPKPKIPASPIVMKLVVVESPLAGRHGASCVCVDCGADRVRNTRYLGDAMLDCFRKGEAPFASHRLYPGILNDNDPADRKLGMEAGLLWARHAEASVVYRDLGISSGMAHGIQMAKDAGRVVIYRSLRAWEQLSGTKNET